MYLHEWAHDNEAESRAAMLTNFAITERALDGATILLASYSDESYSGDAYVLLERDGVLYEVHGSHCSCYGLEDQWEPEQTSPAALRSRLEKGDLYLYGVATYGDELRTILDTFPS